MSFHVRNLRANEDWPEDLFMGFNGPALEREWCFVVEHHGSVVGALLTCPMHGQLFLIRVAMQRKAPLMALRALLKATFETARLRGLQGYLTLLDPTVREGGALMGIIRNIGGVQWPEPIVMVWGLMRDIFEPRRAEAANTREAA